MADTPARYDVNLSAAFIAGRDRGTEWAKGQVEVEGAVPAAVLDAERIHEALGSDRGETAHGFLRGVRDVIMSLHPYERPNVIIEVARTSSPTGAAPPQQGLRVRPRRGLWARLHSLSTGSDD
jgi:hypothetical protein